MRTRGFLGGLITGAVLGAAMLLWMVPVSRAEIMESAGDRVGRVWNRGRRMARAMAQG